jgi:hypothetical protein
MSRKATFYVMHKESLIFKYPQINLFRNTAIIYLLFVTTICIFNYADFSTMTGTLFVVSMIALPVLIVEFMAARTFWKKFTFNTLNRKLTIEKYVYFFKTAVIEEVTFDKIQLAVALESRECLDCGGGTFWCVVINGYRLENRLLRILAEKTKSKILEFINHIIT